MKEDGGADTVTENTVWNQIQNRDHKADQGVKIGPIRTPAGHRSTYNTNNYEI